MSVLLAVQNADVLRALAAPEPDLTMAGLAVILGRDKSNLHKTVGKLREVGFVAGETLALTSVGSDLLPRLDVLEGVTSLPEGFLSIPHAELASHPLNPRKSFDAEALDELRQDILQAGGITSSLLVRPVHDADLRVGRKLSAKYWIVAGERRWRAIGLAIDEDDLPATYALPCQVREMTDAEHLRLSIGENIQRVDLDHVELGQQFEALLLTGEDTPQTIAERLSKTPEYVQQHVRILRLDDDSLAQLKNGEMTFKQGLAMVARPRPKVEAALELDLDAGRPAPEIELQGALERFGTASPATLPADEPPASYAAASGREEGAPKLVPTLTEPPRQDFQPSAKMRLILMEVADKVGRDEMARFREGYTAVAEVPAGGAAPELVRARAIGFRSIGGKDEVRIDPRGPGKAWLDQLGWDRDDAWARRARIGDAAIDVGIGLDRARIAYDGKGYISEWLNMPASQQVAVQADPPAAAPVLEDSPSEDCSPDEVHVIERVEALEVDWTAKPYRFPPTSPSLPQEHDFRDLLTKFGIILPLSLGEGDEAGVIFDAFGDAVIKCDVTAALTASKAVAIARLVRIAVHVCAGEAAQKAL